MRATPLFRNFNLFCSRCLFFCKKRTFSINSELYEDLVNQVQKYRKELKSHLNSSLRHRYLINSIENLNKVVAEMECKRLKIETPVNDISLIPSSISLEILSNGTTHTGPSVVIKTPFKTYLFNCPEGTSRFLPSLRVKATNIYDFFITRALWENIGGISGVLLAKEVTNVQNRIHGPQKIKQYLECLRPFIDADFGTAKYPVSVEELTYEKEFFEDPALKVTYIPLFGPMLIKNRQTVDVSYLLEFKNSPRRIDILKVLDLKIPKGPLIGQLKSGQTITLSDGRIIRPEDVYADNVVLNDESTILITDVENEEKLASICFKNKTKKMKFIVHFSDNILLKSRAYMDWMHSFGDQCTHIIVNYSGLPLPQGEGPYLHQNLLNQLNSDIFKQLYPKNIPDVIGQDYDLDSNIILANNLQRFLVRGSYARDDVIMLEITLNELEERLKTSPKGKDEIKNLKQFSAEVEKLSEDRFPTITFLGTSSAMPSKYRNVSAYLLQLNEKCNIFIDCGEGAYGQLKVLYGPTECEKILVNLKAIFITHAHQDHMNGLYLLIVKRIEAFKIQGVPYKSLIVVCNRNVRMPLGIYSRNFDDIEKYIIIVDVSLFMKLPSALISTNNQTKKNTGNYQKVVVDIIKHLPNELYSAEDWNLQLAIAVQVHHTRMANGFIFVDNINGRKVVFSGDTMPCNLLIEQGMNADILIHECTFEDDLEEDAFRKRHSTMHQAYDVGRRMQAKNIIFSHFSARYTKIMPIPDYIIEAKNVSFAMDNMIVRYDRLSILPKLLFVFREIYSTEIFDFEVRRNQRVLRRSLNNKQQKDSKLLESKAC